MDSRGRRILVVDDDPQVLKFLCDYLGQAGYVVDAAPSGEAALERIESARPDLVSLDLVMPGRIDGWAVMEHLEKRPDPPPIVVLSGQADELRRFPPSVVGVVHKAEDPRQLLDVCARVLVGLPSEGASAPGAERRRARRRPLVVPVRVSVPRGMDLGEGQLVRLSPIGADLEIDVSLSGWAIVRLKAPIPSRKKPVEIDGEVHPRGTSGGTYVYGISFVNVTPEVQRLLSRMLAE